MPLLTSMGTPFPAQGSTTGIGAVLAIQLTGQAELLARLQALERELASEVLTTAMYKAMLVVARTAALRYMSGPRPSILGVKTNLLRSSLMPKGQSAPDTPDTIWEIRQSGTTVEGRLGSRVKYAAIHEEGGTIRHPGGTAYVIIDGWARFVSNRLATSVMARTRAHNIVIPSRPYLRPAVEWSEPDVNTVFNAEVNRALTQRGL